MYTGRYQRGDDIRIPDGYDGTMLSDESTSEPDDTVGVSATPRESILSGLFRGGLTGLGDIPILKRLNIGIEEILICAVALFLLTSKSGDKECAVMLLLLLFVT